MRTFPSLLSFAQFAEKTAALSIPVLEAGIVACAENIHRHARALYGNEGKLPPPLAPSTQEDRSRKGFTPNETLLRTGSLRDSVQVHVEGLVAGVGTSDKRQVWQEMGTFRNGKRHIPPRPLLRIAVDECHIPNQLIIHRAAKVACGIGDAWQRL